MIRSADRASRPDQAVGTNLDVSAANDQEILVDERTIADRQPDAVIQIDRGSEVDAVPGTRHQIVEQAHRLVLILEEDAVDAVAGRLRLPGQVRQRLRLAVLHRTPFEQATHIVVGFQQGVEVNGHELTILSISTAFSHHCRADSRRMASFHRASIHGSPSTRTSAQVRADSPPPARHPHPGSAVPRRVQCLVRRR